MAGDSETRTAAAILACEASRQQLTLMKGTGPRDVPGELLQLYQWYIDQLSRPAPPPGARKGPEPGRTW
jgi:hypothetical protein